ncbi:Ldh family oxidoreductase [Alicyclobacillus tolerans]|uniref:Ldh family oxidoreductase n=1 Tax=Alicyclobacillus tolerans TaxID=90970 RepID=UPI001F20BA4C|nr:Ldh family oxidoreductase [Alicyclobacillus tolerans]MCF8565154.1 Ldh family oxidoreductase [Alicyclobacillus tolerans]
MEQHYVFNEKLRVDYNIMHKWVVDIFQASGMDSSDAIICADNLVSTDARGVYSHGVMRVPVYVKRLLLKVTHPTAQPEVIRDSGATALITGNNAMGQVVGVHAMNVAIEKAKQYGVGYVSVRGSNHYGASAHFAMMPLSEDMIGISGTIGGTNIMAPWGGSSRMLGNNPFGVAIPALNRYPIVLDMAQSVVARGKIVMARKTKQPIPKTWAFAPDGSPTTDAEEAYNGTVRPIGDYKGYGLTYVNAIISALLPGAAFGPTVTDLYEEFSTAQDVGHFMQVIKVSSFMDPAQFKKSVDDSIDYLKNSPRKEGVDEILVPGELEARSEKQQREQGVVYPIEVIRELIDVSNNLGVTIPVNV